MMLDHSPDKGGSPSTGNDGSEPPARRALDKDEGEPVDASGRSPTSALRRAERIQREYLRAQLESERQELVTRWGRALDALNAGQVPENSHWAKDFRRWAAAIRLLDERIDAIR